MIGAIDLTAFEDVVTDVGVAVGVVGGALVTAYVATKSFGFITAWVKKLMDAAKGRAAG